MPFWKNWSIRTRLLLITLVPVVYLFVSLVGYSWRSHLLEAREELAERGQIVTTALAQSLEYNVGARNLPGLKQAIHGLVQSDRSIYRIDILDVNRHELVHESSQQAGEPESRYFEAPIKKELIWVTFTEGSGKAEIDARMGSKSQDTVGYVQVRMSPTNMLAKQNRRFYIELTMALLALVVSGALVYFLSKSLTRPLHKVVEALRDIRSGYYGTQVAITSGGEIGELQASLNAMTQSLKQATLDLENKVAARTRDLEASRNEAIKADAEKRRLIQKVHTIVEDERKSIAIEIHDELNAALVGARLELERIAQLAAQLQTDQAAHADPADHATPSAASSLPEIESKARAVIKLTRELYANGRSLVRRLRPEILEMLGLSGAVEDMLKHYNANPESCRFVLDYAGDFAQLESALAISAYRIIQEALSNIIKHANASHAQVFLEVDADRGVLLMEIDDDGCGFEPGQTSLGIGITGMRERVYAFDGTIALQSRPGQGTRIEIALPLRRGG
jgi:two-component system sensor histidine kinase UhpB